MRERERERESKKNRKRGNAKEIRPNRDLARK